ncbi:neuroglian-like [Phlebotomus argentipes]|uniref:neuroglian-like n=1 Tax=Phlebotomus argentipes TaxID=94469 RepID=UPI002893227F|nr:neuroglian-like [Phlebotomus argentipes]
MKTTVFLLFSAMLLATAKADGAPLTDPEDLSATTSDPGCVLVSWKAVPEDKHNGEGFHYSVFWTKDVEYETHHVDVHDWTQTRCKVCDLEPNTLYRFTVLSRNKNGGVDDESDKENYVKVTSG